MFEKYIHLERFGTDEVDNINLGECYIFPKIDGTNSQVWNEDGVISYGSRNRVLSLDNDNQGFMAWAIKQENIHQLLRDHPSYKVYGEYLIPHSLKTYREDAWGKLYVFDIMDGDKFIHYDEYSALLNKYNIEYIPCILKAINPTYEILLKTIEQNKYLIQENSGIGEGIVIKQYNYKNRFGRTTWAKLITNSFKEKHIKEMGANVVRIDMIEQEIADEFITSHFVEKVFDKIRNDEGLFASKHIPRLLSSVYHDLITEEFWEVLKKYKNPKIDFKNLNHFTINKVKTLKPELFGIS